MNSQVEGIFERVAGPLRRVSDRLAVARCPSCGEPGSLFVDLRTGDFRCGRLPESLLLDQPECSADEGKATR
jgi:hypothetical protein